jgi:hypothetical protein
MDGPERCAGGKSGSGVVVVAENVPPRNSQSAMSNPQLSLESRLGLLRRRRRVTLLKQLLTLIAPVVMGATLLLLLAAFGAAASSR